MSVLYEYLKDFASDCPECGKPVIVQIDGSQEPGELMRQYEYSPGGARCEFCLHYVHVLCLPEIVETECCSKCSQKYFSASGERIA